jgi:hypothetical protein
VGATEAGRASARIARPRPGIILGVEHYPYGLLTMIVSLEVNRPEIPGGSDS